MKEINLDNIQVTLDTPNLPELIRNADAVSTLQSVPDPYSPFEISTLFGDLECEALLIVKVRNRDETLKMMTLVTELKGSCKIQLPEQTDLNLKRIRLDLHQYAIELFAVGDISAFLFLAGSHYRFEFFLDNARHCEHKGLYEVGLLTAYSDAKHNNCRFNIDDLELVFARADKAKLLAAGDTLPDGETFTVYRGVSGKRFNRHVDSYSWTLDLNIACWFALWLNLPNPAVYRAVVKRDDILAYIADREEQEVICRPRTRRNLHLTLNQMRENAKAHNGLPAEVA